MDPGFRNPDRILGAFSRNFDVVKNRITWDIKGGYKGNEFNRIVYLCIFLISHLDLDSKEIDCLESRHKSGVDSG